MRLCLALVLPLLPGCLAFGYPSVSRTPPLAVPEPDARAFLATSEFTRGGCVIAGSVQLSRSVREIPVRAAAVPSQWDSYFSYYYLLFPFTGCNAHSARVLLYRPGYETVEVRPRPWWQCLDGRPVGVTWK